MTQILGNLNKMPILSILYVCLILCLITSGASATELLVAPAGTLDWLGYGIDSKTRYKKEKCLTGTQIPTTTRSLGMKFDHGLSYEEFNETTYGRISAGVNFIIFGGSASVSLTHTYTETSSRLSSVLVFDYIKDTISLEDRSYSTIGQNVLGSSPLDQRNTCGDQFIHSAKLGAKLTLAANLEFETEDEYNQFILKIKIRVLFFKKTITKVKEFKEHAEGGMFSLKIDQFGGRTTELDQILSQNPTYCPVETIESCLDTLDLLFQYLFSDTGYVADVDNDLKILEYTTEPYIESGHMALQGQTVDGTDPGFSILETDLSNLLGDNVRKAEKIRNLLHKDGANQAELNSKLEAANNNIVLLEGAMVYCENNEDYNACYTFADAAVDSLEPVDI